MTTRGGTWWIIIQFALLFVLCAALLNLPLPPLFKNAPLTYSDVLAAVVFLGLGFYLGYQWNLKRLQKMKRQLLWDELSRREQDVAKLLLKGLTNKEICEALFIENNTVKSHVKNIYKKTNSNGRTELKKRLGR